MILPGTGPANLRMPKEPQEKRFGWGTVIAVALGGYIVGDLGDGAPAPAPPLPLEVPAEEVVNAQPQSLFGTPPQNSEPAAEPEPAYEAPTYFANCSAARAAGAAPVRRGDPGYAPHLDRDHDGVGCE